MRQLYRIWALEKRARTRARAFIGLVSILCLWAPAKDWGPRRRHLVQSTDRKAARLVPEVVGVLPGELHDVLDGCGERVERRPALGLGGLDHHRLGNDERKVDGRRVVATFEQALGHV